MSFEAEVHEFDRGMFEEDAPSQPPAEKAPLEVSGVAFPYYTNSSLTPRHSEGITPDGYSGHNSAVLHAALCQKGVLAAGGDERIATDAYDNNPVTDCLPFYRHPDVSGHELGQLKTSVWERLNGRLINEGHFPPEDRIVGIVEANEAVDMVLFDGQFPQIEKVVREHEARLFGQC